MPTAGDPEITLQVFAPDCNTPFDTTYAGISSTWPGGTPVPYAPDASGSMAPSKLLDPPGGEPATCPPSSALTGMCMPGDDEADCPGGDVDGLCHALPPGSLLGGRDVGRCAVVPTGGTTGVDINRNDGVTCATLSQNDEDDGNYPLVCAENQVMVGFGVSNQYGTLYYPDKHRNAAFCTTMGPGYAVNRLEPTIVYSTGYGSTPTCPADKFVTAYCKSTGGNSNCVPPDAQGNYDPHTSAAGVQGWIRCDSIVAGKCPKGSEWQGHECVQSADSRPPCLPGLSDNGNVCTAPLWPPDHP